MGWFSKSTDDFFMSTTTPPSIGIDQYVGVVNGEAIIGANIFRDLLAGLTDIVGGRSRAYESAMRDAREIALKEMCDEARRRGGNAVVGVDLDYETLGSGSMLMVSATGTAVRLR
jgi:uncharacterized protein YbjQ (UPF0145 family)